MSKSTKAALLSALVFPGSGHFSLKKPVQGTLLSGIALFCLYPLISTTLKITQELSVKIQSGEIPLDVTKITELVSQQLAGGNGQLINIASIILVICWIIGIADSYRLGLKQDKNENGTSKKS